MALYVYIFTIRIIDLTLCNLLPYAQWANLCKAYLTEAKWYHSGHKPTLEDYLKNAVVSIGAPIMLFGAYFLTTEKITVEALDYIDKLPSIMWCPSMILRLTNDLGTSSVRCTCLL